MDFTWVPSAPGAAGVRGQPFYNSGLGSSGFQRKTRACSQEMGGCVLGRKKADATAVSRTSLLHLHILFFFFDSGCNSNLLRLYNIKDRNGLSSPTLPKHLQNTTF